MTGQASVRSLWGSCVTACLRKCGRLCLCSSSKLAPLPLLGRERPYPPQRVVPPCHAVRGGPRPVRLGGAAVAGPSRIVPPDLSPALGLRKPRGTHRHGGSGRTRGLRLWRRCAFPWTALRQLAAPTRLIFASQDQSRDNPPTLPECSARGIVAGSSPATQPPPERQRMAAASAAAPGSMFSKKPIG